MERSTSASTGWLGLGKVRSETGKRSGGCLGAVCVERVVGLHDTHNFSSTTAAEAGGFPGDAVR